MCTCNIGYTGQNGHECTACAAGKYKAVSGPSDCLSCPKNSHPIVASAGENDCRCDNGTTLSDSGDCVACKAGEYSISKDRFDHPHCVKCPDHTSSPEKSVKKEDCKCKPGFTGPDGGGCTACAAGKFKIYAGSVLCSLCPDGKTSPDGSQRADDCTSILTPTQEPSGTQAVVKMEVVLPYSETDFDQMKQQKFKGAIAQAALVDVSKIQITVESETSRRRHLLAGSIRIVVEITVQDFGTAQSIVDRMTLDILNRALQAAGLPPAVEFVPPEVVSDGGNKRDTTIIVVSCIVGLGFLFSCLVAFCIYKRKTTNKNADRLMSSLLPKEEDEPEEAGLVSLPLQEELSLVSLPPPEVNAEGKTDGIFTLESPQESFNTWDPTLGTSDIENVLLSSPRDVERERTQVHASRYVDMTKDEIAQMMRGALSRMGAESKGPETDLQQVQVRATLGFQSRPIETNTGTNELFGNGSSVPSIPAAGLARAALVEAAGANTDTGAGLQRGSLSIQERFKLMYPQDDDDEDISSLPRADDSSDEEISRERKRYSM